MWVQPTELKNGQKNVGKNLGSAGWTQIGRKKLEFSRLNPNFENNWSSTGWTQILKKPWVEPAKLRMFRKIGYRNQSVRTGKVVTLNWPSEFFSLIHLFDFRFSVRGGKEMQGVEFKSMVLSGHDVGGRAWSRRGGVRWRLPIITTFPHVLFIYFCFLSPWGRLPAKTTSIGTYTVADI